MRQLFCVLTAFALSLSLQLPADAQLRPDVDNPALDFGDPNGRPDIPTLLPGLNLPEIQFLFDTALDPQRLSLIESVTSRHVNDPRLTEAAKSIIRNHMAALQQVELAIQFLQANRDNILTGTNTNFNSVFGNPGTPREVAITSPNPLSGLADVTINAMTGDTMLDFDDATFPNLLGQVNVGDFVFVGDAPNGDPDGFVAQVTEILSDVDGTNQMLMVETIFGIPTTTGNANLNAVEVYRVIRFEQQNDPARYDRVLATYESIRDALSGQLPGVPAILRTTTGQPITYNREFADISTIWAPGIAPFTQLDGVVQNTLNDVPGLTFNSTRGADRLVRQAGFSNSDSHLHIDRLADQANGQTTDYQGRQTLPLLWTEDNEVPLQLRNNLAVAGATDEDRAFFNNRQTIFGEPDNPFTQYIGRAFLEELILHDGDFFDTSVAVDNLDQAAVRARRPQRGPLFDLDGDGTAGNGIIIQDPTITALIGDIELADVPESGNPTSKITDLRKWQMIIASFAEHSTDLTRLDVAVFGLGNMFGSFVPDDFRAQAAGNFGRFAALIGGSALGAIDPRKIEPFGKRGGAGFFPVVPRQ
jgi:hypothetical protein